MILIDANVLVYAHVIASPHHEQVRAWLDGQLGRTARVGLPWPSLLAFVRLVTNPRVVARPLAIPKAWAQVESWLEAPAAWVPRPTEEHTSHLRACLAVRGLRANDIPDAHLAALAREHGLRIATSDAGFARFPDVEWFDPAT